MRDRRLLALFFSATFVAFPGVVRGALVAGYTQAGSQAVVDGVEHGWGSSETDAATQKVNVLNVAHDAPDLEFDLGLPSGAANGRQRTSSQALAATKSDHRVVAAVNGDFWQTQKQPFTVHAPAGLNIRNGELVSGETSGLRGALGFTSTGVALIGTPTLTVAVTLPGDATLAATGVNRVRHADELVVFTPLFGPSTGTDSTGTEVVLTGASLPMTTNGTYAATVAEIHQGAGDTHIGAGELVLSATGSAAGALAGIDHGDHVTITTSIDAGWVEVVTAVGGNLLFTPTETPDFSDPKFQVANPRTAAGITADGDVLLITVDGRSETSGGMILTDLIEMMRGMGAVQGINLDGGGSTTMVVDPAGDGGLEIVNDPSASYERRVNTTLQLVSTKQDAQPTVSAPAAQIVAGVGAGKSDAQVRLSWSSSRPLAGRHFQLQRRDSHGRWIDVDLDQPDTTSTVRRFTFGKAYLFRVRLVDATDKATDWVVSPVYVLKRFNEGNPQITHTGKWTIKERLSAIGKHLAHSSYDGKSHVLSMAPVGAQVAVVAQKSTTAGPLQITIGTTVAVVDTHAGSTQPRMVVYVGSGSSISVASAATPAHPSADLDAFLVLTSS